MKPKLKQAVCRECGQNIWITMWEEEICLSCKKKAQEYLKKELKKIKDEGKYPYYR